MSYPKGYAALYRRIAGRPPPPVARRAKAVKSNPAGVSVYRAQRAARSIGVDLPAEHISARELARGMAVEQEHEDIAHGDYRVLARIAMAHLRERPDYYQRLAECVEDGG